MSETKEFSVEGFKMENEEKLDRAINGTVGRDGQLYGGVGEKATGLEVMAEYDKLGGLITKGGVKVKTGSFYDFAAKKPRKVPEISYLTDIEGEIVETTEEEAKAVLATKKKMAELKAKKAKK